MSTGFKLGTNGVGTVTPPSDPNHPKNQAPEIAPLDETPTPNNPEAT
jgi:hypothetical protein